MCQRLIQTSSNIEDQYRGHGRGRTDGFDVLKIPWYLFIPLAFMEASRQPMVRQGSYWFRQCLCCSIFYRYRWLDKWRHRLKLVILLRLLVVWCWNPETKVSTGVLKFVVSDVSWHYRRNHCWLCPWCYRWRCLSKLFLTVSLLIRLSFLGTSATTYGQNLAFHKDDSPLLVLIWIFQRCWHRHARWVWQYLCVLCVGLMVMLASGKSRLIFFGAAVSWVGLPFSPSTLILRAQGQREVA